MPSRPGASDRGTSVTAVPRATNSRIAIGSRVIDTTRGSNPAARQARAISPSVDAADHGSSASSRSSTRSRPARRCSRPDADQERLAQHVMALQPGVLAPLERRVLERDAEVQLAGPHALRER